MYCYYRIIVEYYYIITVQKLKVSSLQKSRLYIYVIQKA